MSSSSTATPTAPHQPVKLQHHDRQVGQVGHAAQRLSVSLPKHPTLSHSTSMRVGHDGRPGVGHHGRLLTPKSMTLCSAPALVVLVISP
jgi:hypothetical protein